MENYSNLDSLNRRNPLIIKGFDTKKPQNISETSVIPLGLEPKTHSLEGCCSIQLSYGTPISSAVSRCLPAKSGAKVGIILRISKYLCLNLYAYLKEID